MAGVRTEDGSAAENAYRMIFLAPFVRHSPSDVASLRPHWHLGMPSCLAAAAHVCGAPPQSMGSLQVRCRAEDCAAQCLMW